MSKESTFARVMMCYGARMHAEQFVIDTFAVYPEFRKAYHLKEKVRVVISGDRAEKKMDDLITKCLEIDEV
ncbi:hypothetical protein [Serratia liquefaciens]|uniref:hypothetical protein n=1 Tax=Serratia liquefaciens TaxID=614 RepID=UPI00165D0A19|nr:hypothetical protein [Serratia liquefaciens]QNQ52585.1 hypothetical protein IAI46_15150 [Serratia liquefaciens]